MKEKGTKSERARARGTSKKQRKSPQSAQKKDLERAKKRIRCAFLHSFFLVQYICLFLYCFTSIDFWCIFFIYLSIEIFAEWRKGDESRRNNLHRSCEGASVREIQVYQGACGRGSVAGDIGASIGDLTLNAGEVGSKISRKADACQAQRSGEESGLREELVKLIEGLALDRTPRKLSTIHRLVSDIAEEHGWAKPSYAQVYRVVRSMREDRRVLGKEGAVAYRERFDLVYCRQASRANVIWQADHCRLRVYVVKEGGEGELPWLTVIEDDHSRAIMGYRLSWSAPSSAQTSLVLRDAIGEKREKNWPMQGVPESFYTDHGSDFTSKHMEEVAVDLRMGLIFSQVKKPRGRGKVERFFVPFRKRCSHCCLDMHRKSRISRSNGLSMRRGKRKPV